LRKMGEGASKKVSGLTANEGIRADSPWPGLKLVDMGVDAPGGWSAGKILIETVIDGLGEVNFGEFYINGFALPSVDIYFDHPAKTRLPESKNVNGKAVCFYENQRLLYAEVNKIPDLSDMEDMAAAFGCKGKELTLAVTSPTSLVAAIYGCSLAASGVLEHLLKKGLAQEEILWAWATAPLPPLADDPGIMADRLKAALAYGAVTSFWVRTGDEKIKEAFDGMDRFGELRMHNLSSARTFIHGSVDRMKLQEAFRV